MFVSPSYGVGVRIDFAHDAFRWRNEANGQAHALVVIVGFSKCGVREKTFFHYLSPDGEPVASHPDVIMRIFRQLPMRSFGIGKNRFVVFLRLR